MHTANDQTERDSTRDAGPPSCMERSQLWRCEGTPDHHFPLGTVTTGLARPHHRHLCRPLPRSLDRPLWTSAIQQHRPTRRSIRPPLPSPSLCPVEPGSS